MNSLLKIQADYKALRKTKIPPFWKFFFRNFLIDFNKKINGLLKENTEINLLNYNNEEASFAHIILKEKFSFFMQTSSNHVPILISLSNVDANSLLSKLYGGEFSFNLNRELTPTNISQLNPFFDLVIQCLNNEMEKQKRNLSFQSILQSNFMGEVIKLDIQIGLITVYVYIPVNLFKLTLITE
jgi:hypothetical protein